MLTIEQIEHISFRRSGIGGYKTEDVDTFVDGVIETIKDSELTKREMQARIEQQNLQIIKFESQAKSVQDAIITAEMTAKKIESEAQEKADRINLQADAQAQKTLSDADAKAQEMIHEAEMKAQAILNSALSRSAASIDENNRIITQQKQHIIQIQSEVTRFREALIDSYKNHLRLINSLPKAEEFQQYQEKLEESYPEAVPVTPADVEQEVRKEAEKTVEQNKQEQPQIKVEMVDTDRVKAISEEMRTNAKAQEALLREQQNEPKEVSFVSTNVTLTEDEEKVTDRDFDPDATLELDAEAIRNAIAESQQETTDESRDDTAEDTPEAPAAESKDDNAEEIEALVNSEAAAAGQSDEPKPVSIDELDNGSIFGTEDSTEDSKEEESNNRQPIQLDDEKPTE